MLDLSGLVVAWRARREGLSVALLEASDRTGGSIQTLDVDGVRFDAGASSLLLRHPRVEAILDEAGLGRDVLEPGPEVKRRLVLHRGALAALPTGPLSFLATRLFSCCDKLGLLREPWRARALADREESIADFTRRRLGRSFRANAVGPFVSGV